MIHNLAMIILVVLAGSGWYGEDKSPPTNHEINLPNTLTNEYIYDIERRQWEEGEQQQIEDLEERINNIEEDNDE